MGEGKLAVGWKDKVHKEREKGESHSEVLTDTVEMSPKASIPNTIERTSLKTPLFCVTDPIAI